MSELPELPPAPRLTRPLPAGGLDAAIAGGRRRRQRALAVGGGTTMALAVAVAAVVALPGGGSDELSVEETFADPRPTATGTPGPVAESPTPPVPVPPALATDVPGLPSGAPVVVPLPGDPLAAPRAQAGGPVGGAGGAGGPVSGAEPSSAPATGASAGPARPVDERPAYVEDTDEDADGGACSTTTMNPTASSCNNGGGFVAEDVVRRGEQAQLGITHCISQGSAGDDVYFFDGGQEKDVVVTTQNGSDELFRFSLTVRYVQGAHERRLRPGKCVQWTGRWNLVTTDGRPVPAGVYRMSMTLRADRYEQEGSPFPAPRGYEQTVSRDIRVID